eukprot:1975128-Pleurochrysis_carterae.AAC.2
MTHIGSKFKDAGTANLLIHSAAASYSLKGSQNKQIVVLDQTSHQYVLNELPDVHAHKHAHLQGHCSLPDIHAECYATHPLLHPVNAC